MRAAREPKLVELEFIREERELYLDDHGVVSFCNSKIEKQAAPF